jgi:hypothetical protein
MRNLVLVGVLLATSPAFADPPRYARKPKLDIPVQLSNRVKPTQPKATEPAKPITADALLEIKQRQQPFRKEQERVLEKLIKATPDDDPEKPDYMFRLAELYAQQLQFWRIESVEEALNDQRGK